MSSKKTEHYIASCFQFAFFAWTFFIFFGQELGISNSFLFPMIDYGVSLIKIFVWFYLVPQCGLFIFRKAASPIASVFSPSKPGQQ